MADGAAVSDGGDAVPEKHFLHPQAAHHFGTFFFYAFGNTPPTDLLQYVPPDATHADVLSLGCGDLRDMLYSILLHVRSGADCGRPTRVLSFTQNDWEPAIHARNIILLQMILDSRNLLRREPNTVDDITRTRDAVAFERDSGRVGRAEACTEVPKEQRSKRKGPEKKGSNKKGSKMKVPKEVASDNNKAVSEDSPGDVSFAQMIGGIFSAMYNSFVDADVLGAIHDVARRLAASTSSPDKWASADLGKIVRFADNRSRERVREILTRYTDESLQGKRLAARVKGERSSFIAKFVDEGTIILSRTLGLASWRESECRRAYSEMRSDYLKHGILDPFPLLHTEDRSGQHRGPCNLVNPLLLVTERKGRAYCLHYGAFPLDAFHTDVVWWKLRPERDQDEYGKVAPRVTKHQDVNAFIRKDGPTATPIPSGVMKKAWLGAALEELAQMCGAFLRATAPTVPVPAGSRQQRLAINVQAGDAINFCDALVAMPRARESTEGDSHDGGSSSGHSAATVAPIAFQQGSLHPLHLHADLFSGSRPDFNVISTSNLAEHLGLVNLLVATAPLLKNLPHATLLTSLLAAMQELDSYKDTTDFYKKIMCMTPQTASVLLGLVPVSSLSSVVSQADTLARFCMESPGLFDPSTDTVGPGASASQLRLQWKQATQAFTETTASSMLVDICPAAFVDLTLPVYKAMMSHITSTETIMSGLIAMSKNIDVHRALSTPNHYTPASFGRLLGLASRRLRLGTAHFEAALDATIHCSGLFLASNLAQEQVALFQALDLAPIRQSYGGPMRSIPLDTRRVVLLVPQSGISLLREFVAPEVFLSLTDKSLVFDNHFVSIHMAYVRVRRGSGSLNDDDISNGWRALNKHLVVRDAREDDPEAELMVSAVVPTFGLRVLPPSMVDLQLCPRDSTEIFFAPKKVKKRLGIGMWKCPVVFKADLADVDRTAVLTPGLEGCLEESEFVGLLALPAKGLSGAFNTASHFDGANDNRGARGQNRLRRFRYDDAAIDQSIELRCRGSAGDGSQLACTVTLSMANDLAQQSLRSASPAVEATLDVCSVRVTLGEGRSHTTHLPFPLKWNAIRMKVSKRQGFVVLTIPPADQPFQLPVTRSGGSYNNGDVCCPDVPSALFWTPCAPLISLPKLDLKAEWAHEMVFGVMSIHLLERSPLRKATDSATVGVKKSLLHIVDTVCKNHNEDRPGWKHPWVCITERGELGNRAIWIWVNDVLLDSSNEALMLDCCIISVERMVDAASARLGAAIDEDNDEEGGPGIYFVEASAGEVHLWESLIPVAVERARQTYVHAAECSYNKLGDGDRRVLCRCGKGKDLPRAFKLPMKTTSAVDEGPPLQSLVYRAALSPLYAPTEMACFSPSGETVGSAGVSRSTAGRSSKCAKCGKGGLAMKCARCHGVSYCSKECQRKDWKRHKPSCG